LAAFSRRYTAANVLWNSKVQAARWRHHFEYLIIPGCWVSVYLRIFVGDFRQLLS
jgi:hypothetical protein